jgi:hypothetical protein
MQGLWRGLGLGLGKTKLVPHDGEAGWEKKPVRSWRMGDAYEKKMAHHEGIKQLWETKWKFPVSCRRIRGGKETPEMDRTDRAAIVLDFSISLPRWKIRGF